MPSDRGVGPCLMVDQRLLNWHQLQYYLCDLKVYGLDEVGFCFPILEQEHGFKHSKSC